MSSMPLTYLATALKISAICLLMLQIGLSTAKDCSISNKEYFLNGFDAGTKRCNMACSKDMENIKRDIRRLQSSQNGKGGPVYIRWGKKTCPTNGTVMVYSGFVAGSLKNNQGAAVNYQCMPTDPQFGYIVSGYQNNEGILVGAEYSTGHVHDDRKHVNNYNVPCAVCHVTERSAVYSMPGRQTCYGGWHMEYTGYLMSGYWNNKASTEYICVDGRPEKLRNNKASASCTRLYPVEAVCQIGLPCSTYRQGNELTCVVCSK